VSANYQFSEIFLKPYIGLFVGYSQLDWDKRPHPVLPSEDLSSNFPMYGIQLGAEYDLNIQWSIFAKYQYADYQHTMDILWGRDTVSHDSANHILLGVRYAF
jgi:opacity protein-like surface antigen